MLVKINRYEQCIYSPLDFILEWGNKRNTGQITITNSSQTPFSHSTNICRLDSAWSEKRWIKDPQTLSFNLHDVCSHSESISGRSRLPVMEWLRHGGERSSTGNMALYRDRRQDTCGEHGVMWITPWNHTWNDVTSRVNSTSIKKREGGNALFLQVSFCRGFWAKWSHLRVANI